MNTTQSKEMQSHLNLEWPDVNEWKCTYERHTNFPRLAITSSSMNVLHTCVLQCIGQEVRKIFILPATVKSLRHCYFFTLHRRNI